MRIAYDFEKYMGIEYFITDTIPLLGKIKFKADDFIVEEILKDGTILAYNKKINLNLPNKGRYLYLIVKKRNITTNDVIHLFLQKYRLKLSDIGVYGIKDRRAIAVQCFSLRNVKAEEIINSKFKNIEILGHSYAYGPARLGHHLGNNFTLLIRDVRLDENSIKEVLEKITIQEFIPNYFGYQRFGIPRPVTHKIGEAIIKNDYEKAVDELIGTIDPLESEERILARKIFLDTHDPKEALKYFPEELLYERIVLEHLLHNPNDYLGALAKLPTPALRLFIEAYSSYLFNRFLSKRLSLGMLNIEEGDLVSPIDSGVPVFFSLTVGSGITKERAKELLSKDKIAIVLPVLGYKVKISSGIMGDLIREILIEEGIRPQDFKIWLGNKFIGLKGSYRRIDLKPLIKLSYNIIKDDIFNTNTVQLNFALYRGCYATVLLREIMKHPFPGSYFGKVLKGS
ncbi:MAG: tRNA pseudouridine(13) synthase TruD [Thermoproteota archaeon]|jgi:tRNA pseudouridine13 synthase|nr:tRNA pseudouridine(13) synthase TruD [Thermoproteota archaeon]